MKQTCYKGLKEPTISQCKQCEHHSLCMAELVKSMYTHTKPKGGNFRDGAQKVGDKFIEVDSKYTKGSLSVVFAILLPLAIMLLVGLAVYSVVALIRGFW